MIARAAITIVQIVALNTVNVHLEVAEYVFKGRECVLPALAVLERLELAYRVADYLQRGPSWSQLLVLLGGVKLVVGAILVGVLLMKPFDGQ